MVSVSGVPISTVGMLDRLQVSDPVLFLRQQRGNFLDQMAPLTQADTYQVTVFIVNHLLVSGSLKKII